MPPKNPFIINGQEKNYYSTIEVLDLFATLLTKKNEKIKQGFKYNRNCISDGYEFSSNVKGYYYSNLYKEGPDSFFQERGERIEVDVWASKKGENDWEERNPNWIDNWQILSVP